MSTIMENVLASEAKKEKKVKCLVWDLDNTIWDGVLLEDREVTLRKGVVDVIKAIDERGILQSISSKNEYDIAMEKLKHFGLSEYFIYPEINWNPKSQSVKNIAKNINIGIDTIAFIDDQDFELEEVAFSNPQVLCINTNSLNDVLNMPEMNPLFITEDSKIRRKMYQSDIVRKNLEDTFSGTQEEFLETLNMRMTISGVTENDLQRAEELTVRTHQLNTTGYTYSYQELNDFRSSPNHKLLIAELEDKYGTYGKIGLALIEKNKDYWMLKLLLMSCRVMSRGVGSVMLNHIMQKAKDAGVKLRAEFVSNDRNRMMIVTYKFAGFNEIEKNGEVLTLENNLENIQGVPEYVDLKIVE